MRGADRFEYATDQDPSLNYCLWEYSPAAPAADKFRSVNLLYQSFDVAGLDERAFGVVEALREGIGPFRTVFGIKLLPDRLAWELYFYDYRRLEREVSIGRVLAALAPQAPCALRADEAWPYFMFSLDLDPELVRGERGLDVVHVYVGNAGSSVSSGISHDLTADGLTLQNLYFFFDGTRQLDEAGAKIAASPHFDGSRLSLDRVLVPELRTCRTICVANKRSHDCVYFSGVDVHQLLFFLERLAYPEAITSFVRRHRGDLDHLLFDVGFDYRMDGDDLVILKSGYYGVF